jgi:Tfp pilus assembly protein PilF
VKHFTRRRATRAREAFPEDAAVANNLGMVLCRQGDYRNSARLLDECVRKGGADASAMYYLGKAHYQLFLLTPEIKGKAKERKESQEALQQALALNVQTKLADDARRLLAELK